MQLSINLPQHYHGTALINNIAGNLPLVGEHSDEAILKVVRKQAGLIHSEFLELLEGIEDRDMFLVRDGLGDTIVTADGMFHRLRLQYPDTNRWVDRIRPASVSLIAAAEAIQAMKLIAENRDQLPIARIVQMLVPLTTGVLLSMYELANYFKIPLHDDQTVIYASNFSKFDTNREDAEKGVLKYQAIGVLTEIVERKVEGETQTYFVIKSTVDQVGTDGKDYPAGKFLKSIHFFEPSFSALESDEVPIETLIDHQLQILTLNLRHPPVSMPQTWDAPPDATEAEIADAPATDHEPVGEVSPEGIDQIEDR